MKYFGLLFALSLTCVEAQPAKDIRAIERILRDRIPSSDCFFLVETFALVGDIAYSSELQSFCDQVRLSETHPEHAYPTHPKDLPQKFWDLVSLGSDLDRERNQSLMNSLEKMRAEWRKSGSEEFFKSHFSLCEDPLLRDKIKDLVAESHRFSQPDRRPEQADHLERQKIYASHRKKIEHLDENCFRPGWLKRSFVERYVQTSYPNFSPLEPVRKPGLEELRRCAIEELSARRALYDTCAENGFPDWSSSKINDSFVSLTCQKNELPDAAFLYLQACVMLENDFRPLKYDYSNY